MYAGRLIQIYYCQIWPFVRKISQERNRKFFAGVLLCNDGDVKLQQGEKYSSFKK